ncbi:hypothetical protein CVT25_007392 [Psilocybe cyanescens]|uniref:No apical meristem-associated C-terminal domain-containing protein n=1 Tax=Psilocybe cyanescens TaxID=93625 RepID=A0A409XJB5_PSICY|nr:hypothetical protein CVT25_007392 [Psilocybe cyanescens]
MESLAYMWRTDPDFDQTSSKRVGAVRTASRGDSVESSSSTGKLDLNNKRKARQSSTSTRGGNIQRTNTKPRTRNSHYKQENDSSAVASSSQSKGPTAATEDGKFTAAQLHDQLMAELEYKRRKLEEDSVERKANQEAQHMKYEYKTGMQEYMMRAFILMATSLADKD